jgi:hypothetical protein
MKTEELIRVVEEYKDISYTPLLLYTPYTKHTLDGKLLTTSIYIHREDGDVLKKKCNGKLKTERQ